MFHIPRLLLIALTVLMMAGCATPVSLPSNVSVASTPDHSGFIDKVDYSYQRPGARPLAFARLKLCIAENVRNDAITLKDSAGSFVGRATGIYYQADNRQTVGGGSTFKYVDDGTSTLIASGVTRAKGDALGVINYAVRFDLKAWVEGEKVGLVMSNIGSAQLQTGYLRNDGFAPVSVMPGTGAPQIHAALTAAAEQVKQCLQ